MDLLKIDAMVKEHYASFEEDLRNKEEAISMINSILESDKPISIKNRLKIKLKEIENSVSDIKNNRTLNL